MYPHHGAAVIVNRESREFDGAVQEFLVLEMAHGELVLRVPVDKADEVGMRPPIGADEVRDLYELLARKDVPVGSVISEYVDVAHAFYDKRESGFVNGLLDAIAREARSARA